MRALIALVLAVGMAAPLSAAELSISSDPPLPAPNLILNPGIEEGKDGKPKHWGWGTAAPENFRTAWSDKGRTGKCLYLKAETGVMSGYWSQSLKLAPSTEYVLKGWFRINGGKLLCFAHSKTPDGRGIDSRFYASSMRNHYLVPVFLKPEYMAGLDAENWHPFRVPFKTLEKMERVSASLGMYFRAGEVFYDDISITRAKTDLKIAARADEDALLHVKVLAEGEEKPVFDSGPLPAGRKDFEKTVASVSAEHRYVLEVTTRDGKVHRRSYPGGGEDEK